MSVEIPEFWQLLSESRLLVPEECDELAQAFGGVKGAAKQGNSRTLAEWLIAEGRITRYQSTLLLAGTPGPFFYGEYRVHDRMGEGLLAGRFRATHVPTSHGVILEFISGPVARNPHGPAPA